MHILTPTGSQTIKFIPRITDSVYYTFKLVDKSTNEDITPSGFSLSKGDVFAFTVSGFSESLKESRFYTLLVSTGLSYNEANNQTIDQDTNNYYSVNDGEYVSETSYDNDYIIL
jgi:hypothetical protein